MFRILRAFAWMRWRALINAFERTGGRDTLERFSIAIDKIGPIVAAVLLVPSMIGVSALSAVGGYILAAEPGYLPVAGIILRAFALALSGRDVLVVEKADAVGAETSSRNSEVIHAGIYYAPGSLKARLCIEGHPRQCRTQRRCRPRRADA